MNILLLVATLREDEGFRDWSFWDNKQWTWGFGTRAPGPNHRITREKADVELWQRAALAVRDFYLIYGHVEMSEVRGLALANMCYNIGFNGMLKFRNMNAAIDAGRWADAAAEARDSLWFKQVGKRAERIVRELATGTKGDGA